MSRRRSRKNRPEDGAAPQQSRIVQTAPEQARGPRHLAPVMIGICVGVVAIGAAVIWRITRPDAGGPALAAGVPLKVTPAAASLPPPPPGTPVPINTVDPMSAEPIKFNSPTTTHKGYVVAFCCEQSAAYKGGWERMSEAEKDAFVRRWLEPAPLLPSTPSSPGQEGPG